MEYLQIRNITLALLIIAWFALAIWLDYYEHKHDS